MEEFAFIRISDLQLMTISKILGQKELKNNKNEMDSSCFLVWLFVRFLICADFAWINRPKEKSLFSK